MKDKRTNWPEIQHLGDHMGEVVWLSSADNSQLFYVNGAYEEIWGCSHESLHADPFSFLDAIHEDDKEEVKKAYFADPLSYRMSRDFRVVHKDGSIRWVFLNSFPICDNEGQAIWNVCIVYDITDKKDAQAKSEEQEVEFQRVFDAIPDLFFRLNNQGFILNCVVGEQQGVLEKAETVIQKHVSEVFPSGIHETLLERMEESLREKKLVRFEHKLKDLEWYSTSIHPVNDTQVVAVMRDITLLKESEAAALEKSRELEGFFHVSLGLLCIMDEAGRFIKVNKAWENLLGYSTTALEESYFFDFVHPKDQEATKKSFETAKKSEGVSSFQNRCRRYDGSYGIFEWQVNSYQGRIYGSAKDISEIVALKRALEKEKDYLRLIIDSTPHPIFAKDQKGCYTLANEALSLLFGVPKEAILGKGDTSFCPSTAEIDLYATEDQRILREECPKLVVEHSRTDFKGNQRFFHTVKVPLVSEEGCLPQVLGIATDITERKNIEQQIKQQERLYRGLVESQTDLIVRVDTENRFTFVNDAYCRTFGRTKEELLGSSFTPLVHKEDRDATLEAMKSLEAPPYRAYLEQRAKTVLGWRWIAWEDCAIFDAWGNIVEIQGVGRDVTDLKEAKQRAELASEAKSQFLATMSHEIRTPISGLIGLNYLAQQKAADPEVRSYLSRMEDSLQVLLKVINDLLDFSKMEAGDLRITPSSFHLRELVESLEETFLPLAKAKGLILQTLVEEIAPSYVWGDTLRIRQALANLLDNALKFTDKGKVTLEVTARSQDPKQMLLCFRVADTGIGMEKKERERLFLPFSQGDSSTSRRYEGTGLGLSISKRLVELMGGSLYFESEKGQGSVFSLEIPFQKSDYDFPLSLAKLKALVLSSEEKTRNTLREILFKFNYQVQGGESILHARECIARNPELDLLVLDHSPPHLDYVSLLTQPPNREIPVILLLEKKDQESVRAPGCFHVLTKPLKESALLTALGKISSLLCKPTPTAFENARILVVENTPETRELLRDIFVRAKAKVTLAENGKEAVHLVQEQDFDVIMMGVQMPIMGGYEATEALWLLPDTRKNRIPIIAVTAYAKDADKERCLLAGMDDYIAKPFTPEELLQTVSQWIGKRKAQRKQDASLDRLTCPFSSLPGISLSDGLHRYDSKELYLQGLECFEKEGRRLQQEKEEALKHGDFLLLARTIHTLRGSLVAIGAITLGRLCLEIEESLNRKEIPEALLSKLTKDLEELLVAISKLNKETQCSKEEEWTLLLSRMEQLLEEDIFIDQRFFQSLEKRVPKDQELLALYGALKTALEDFDYGDAKVLLQKLKQSSKGKERLS